MGDLTKKSTNNKITEIISEEDELDEIFVAQIIQNGQQLLEASCAGNEREVLRLIQDNADIVNYRDYFNCTALHFASEYGNYNICKILLENGAFPDAQDDFQCTPLHRAIEGNSYSIYQILLESGANPNIKDGDGDTPLNLLLTSGLVDQEKYNICKLLLEVGKADVNLANNDGCTPLHSISECYGEYILQCVKLLIKNGADVNKADINGFTPLHIIIAIKNNPITIVGYTQLLLNNGANVNAVTNEAKETPLHLALKRQTLNIASIELLIKNGADVNAQDKSGCNPMIGLLNRTNPKDYIKEIKEIAGLFIAHGFQDCAVGTIPKLSEIARVMGLIELDGIFEAKPSTKIQIDDVTKEPAHKRMRID